MSVRSIVASLSDLFGPSRSQPKLLIIGVQKAGTTTLYDMLNGAGPFRGSKEKEIGYFSKDALYSKGSAWYKEQFSHLLKSEIGFEATPQYIYFRVAAERIRREIPEARFIVLLREPAARCLSAWNMFRTFNRDQPQAIFDHFTQFSNPEAREPIKKLLFSEEFPSFESCVSNELAELRDPNALPEPSFVRRGLYAQQLEVYFDLFDKSHFLFLEQRDLNDPYMIAAAVGNLMKVKLNANDLIAQTSNQGEYTPVDTATQRTLAMLREFYKPHNERLYQLIDRRFNW